MSLDVSKSCRRAERRGDCASIMSNRLSNSQVEREIRCRKLAGITSGSCEINCRLWLVLGRESQPMQGQKSFLIHPIARKRQTRSRRRGQKYKRSTASCCSSEYPGHPTPIHHAFTTSKSTLLCLRSTPPLLFHAHALIPSP